MKRFSVGVTVMASLRKGFLPTLAVLAGLSGVASAANPAPDLARQRELAAEYSVCAQCHGNNGVPRSAHVPIIAGQRADYLQKQIHDFGSGDRKSEIMGWMANQLRPEEFEPTAVMFAGKHWPDKSASAGAAPTPPPMVAACQACHAPDFNGTKRADGTVAPRLAGQRYDYLLESMGRFANGERPNTANMGNLMKALSPEVRETLAHYLSSL